MRIKKNKTGSIGLSEDFIIRITIQLHFYIMPLFFKSISSDCHISNKQSGIMSISKIFKFSFKYDSNQ